MRLAQHRMNPPLFNSQLSLHAPHIYSPVLLCLCCSCFQLAFLLSCCPAACLLQHVRLYVTIGKKGSQSASGAEGHIAGRQGGNMRCRGEGHAVRDMQRGQRPWQSK